MLRLTPAQKAARDRRLRREGWDRLHLKGIGFTRVLKAISDACRGISTTATTTTTTTTTTGKGGTSTTTTTEGKAIHKGTGKMEGDGWMATVGDLSDEYRAALGSGPAGMSEVVATAEVELARAKASVADAKATLADARASVIQSFETEKLTTNATSTTTTVANGVVKVASVATTARPEVEAVAATGAMERSAIALNATTTATATALRRKSPSGEKMMSSTTSTCYDDVGKSTTVRKVPLVVHDGHMHLLFLLSHFHSQELPPTHEEAKDLIHHYFPTVYDTRVLSSEYSDDSRVRNSSMLLEDLYHRARLSLGNSSSLVGGGDGGFGRRDVVGAGADDVGQDGEEGENDGAPGGAVVGRDHHRPIQVPVLDPLHQLPRVVNSSGELSRWPRLARWHGADRGAYMTGTVFQSLSKVILNDRRDDNIITRYNSESGVGSLYFLDERRNNRASVLFGRNMVSFRTIFIIHSFIPSTSPHEL